MLNRLIPVIDIIKNKKGFVLIFVSFLVPLFLLLFLLTIDGGLIYVRYAEARHLADGAAKSALIEVSGLLRKKAMLNYTEACLVNKRRVPTKCIDPKLKDFLTIAEIQLIIANPATVAFVNSHVRNYIRNLDPNDDADIEDDNIAIEYPYLYNPIGRDVRIKVGIQTKPSFVFSKFVDTGVDTSEKYVSAKSVQSMPLPY